MSRKSNNSVFFQDKTIDSEIDMVLYLQNYKNAWDGGEWIEKYDFEDCIEESPYVLVTGLHFNLKLRYFEPHAG